MIAEIEFALAVGMAWLALALTLAARGFAIAGYAPAWRIAAAGCDGPQDRSIARPLASIAFSEGHARPPSGSHGPSHVTYRVVPWPVTDGTVRGPAAIGAIDPTRAC